VEFFHHAKLLVGYLVVPEKEKILRGKRLTLWRVTTASSLVEKLMEIPGDEQ